LDVLKIAWYGAVVIPIAAGWLCGAILHALESAGKIKLAAAYELALILYTAMAISFFQVDPSAGLLLFFGTSNMAFGFGYLEALARYRYSQ
jgi:hypothetical protein